MFEASKTIRKKTVEERTHVDKDGREFFEWDTYGLVQRLGEEAGRDLNYTEKDIRTNFKLTTLDS